MDNLAIIPARGGSKRIERKNIRPLAGMPVIGYPITAAIQTGLFREVMVSTDDAEIAAIAKEYKASVPFMRSAASSNDTATIADVLLEVVEAYGRSGRKFDNICCLLPTAALITTDKITEAYNEFVSGKFSSLLPVVRFAYPIQRALKAEGGMLSLREPRYLNTRSQDLEPYYHDSAQFYWIRTSDLLKEKTVFTSKTGFIELKETEAQDVDNESDWEMLKIKYQSLKQTAK